MFLQLWFSSLILLVAPYFPRILTPLSYSIASVLLVQKVSPRFILGRFVVFSTLATVVLWYVVWYIITKFQEYQKEKNYKDFISRRSRDIQAYLEKKKVNKGRSRLKRHLASDKGQVTLFILAVIGFMPTIPDFLTVALLQRKLRFWYFILAAIIGKTLEFLPFIFLGKSILSYFKL